jgi:hypothetical protein
VGKEFLAFKSMQQAHTLLFIILQENSYFGKFLRTFYLGGNVAPKIIATTTRSAE